jgi:hypothetical protein
MMPMNGLRGPNGETEKPNGNGQQSKRPPESLKPQAHTSRFTPYMSFQNLKSLVSISCNVGIGK